MHMIVQKRRPVLAGRAREFDDVCRHRGFADIETELEQLATPMISIKMKFETFEVLVEQTLKRHRERMGYNFSNFSLLMNQYHDACEALRRAPDQHLVQLRQEILAEELKRLP